MTQLEFSDRPDVIFGDLCPTVVDQFVDYHRARPEIYEQFKRFSVEIKSSGRDQFGAKAIMERIRFETALRGGDEFKVNNSYASCYARLLAFEDSSFREFFIFRHTKAAA